MLPTLVRKSGLIKKGSVLDRAMHRYREHTLGRRIGFVVDATGSREHTWEQAQKIQGQMFQAVSGLGRIELRLVHFGGGLLTDHGWTADSRALAQKMAVVRCARGCTDIERALSAFLDDETGMRASALILIGDALEEDEADIERAAQALKEAGIRVFSFFEGDDHIAEGVFRRIAEITGGRFAKFGADLPLGDLCEGVALLTAGGKNAVKRLKNEKAKRLLLTGPSDD